MQNRPYSRNDAGKEREKKGKKKKKREVDSANASPFSGGRRGALEKKFFGEMVLSIVHLATSLNKVKF